jgi:C-terminal processing protease CtpA/Prc
LRRERQQSPRAEADATHVAVKTEMLQLRLMEKKRELVRRSDVDALIDGIAGTVLTHLSGMSARCSPDPIGEAQHRRCGDADQARDCGGVQQGGR